MGLEGVLILQVPKQVVLVRHLQQTTLVAPLVHPSEALVAFRWCGGASKASAADNSGGAAGASIGGIGGISGGAGGASWRHWWHSGGVGGHP